MQRIAHLALILALFLVLTSCGSTGAGSDTTGILNEVDSATGTACEGGAQFVNEDTTCPGNKGCTERGVECGMCVCTLCWNEECLVVTCDDGGSEECPGSPWDEPDADG